MSEQQQPELITYQAELDRALSDNPDAHKAFERICQEYLSPKLLRFVKKKLNNHSECCDVLQDVFEQLWKAHTKIRERTLPEFENFVYRLTHNACTNFLRREHQHTAYMLTEKSLSNLRQIGIRAEVLQKLESLRDCDIIGYQNFNRALQRALDTETPSMTRKLIIQYAEQTIGVDILQSIPQPIVQNLANLQEQLSTILQQDLSPEEWNLLQMHDFEGYTFREIAEKTGSKLGTLHARHERILEKLQSHESLRDLWDDYNEVIRDDHNSIRTRIVEN